MTRREFARMSGGLLASLALNTACRGGAAEGAGTPVSAPGGRLAARPRTGAKTTAAAGSHPLGLGGSRDALLHVPAGSDGSPLPLLVLLHGAGGSGAGMARRLATAPADAGIAVLAPDSRSSTWDAVGGSFGADVEFLDRALGRVFDTVAVDPSRLAVGGFSDGASYAISLGLINGDLFPRVVAFSPGFVVEAEIHGKPRVFLSHGVDDTILPINQCGRPIAAALKRAGYDVTYREFAGGHEVPPAIAAEAMRWMAARQ